MKQLQLTTSEYNGDSNISLQECFCSLLQNLLLEVYSASMQNRHGFNELKIWLRKIMMWLRGCLGKYFVGQLFQVVGKILWKRLRAAYLLLS